MGRGAARAGRQIGGRAAAALGAGGHVTEVRARAVVAALGALGEAPPRVNRAAP